MDKLKSLKDKNIIKVLIGISRCGKSTILSQFKQYLIDKGVSKENIISINLDDSNYRELLDEKKLHDYILDNINSKGMNYIFLDEIQNVPSFEKYVDSLFLEII